MAPSTGIPAIDLLSTALEEQRRAILAQDPSALIASGERLLAGIAALRTEASRGGDATSLLEVRRDLRANADLLQRAQALNARALSVLFGSDTVYRADGEAQTAARSRALDVA